MIFNKKAQALSMRIIIVAIILLVVAVIIVVVFRNIFGKQAKELESKVGGLGDCDSDGRADFLDPCPCEADTSPPCKNKLVDKKTCECESK